MVVAASCYGEAPEQQGHEDWSELRKGRMQPNTERLLKGTSFRVHET